MDRLLGRVNRIVGFFHRSDNANTTLQTKQRLLELPKHKLIQDCKTRWNSSYDMLERYIEQQAAVQAVFLNKEIKKNAKDVVTLSDDDVSDIECVLNILKPIKTVTTILCEEAHPTVSMIHPLKERLMIVLTVLDSDSALVRSVKSAIANDLKSRYTAEDSLNFMLEASALDPRFKTLPYLDNNGREAVSSRLVKRIRATNSTQVTVKAEPADGDARGPNQPQLPVPPPEIKTEPAEVATPEKKPRSALNNLFGDVFITKIEPPASLLDRIHSELNNYYQEPVLPLNKSSLDWWQSNSHKYPLLAQTAKSILCVPATSVPSERVFSTAGDIVSAQRASLSQDNVDMLVFLKKNMQVHLPKEDPDDE